MQGRAGVDTSLAERRGILELLGRLAGESVSLAELEQIGLRLRGAGTKGLRPLLRGMERETKGELLAKYAFVLDFFDTDMWLDQLVQIAQRRTDLSGDGKAALQAALEGYGVVLRDDGGRRTGLLPAEETLTEQGMVALLDDFLCYPMDAQLIVLRELPKRGDSRAVRLLEALLWHEEPRIVEGALVGLSRVRHQLAATALARFLESASSRHADLCRKGLRRLSFLGVEPLDTPPSPFHAGFASAPNGDGYRSLLISRWDGSDKLALLYLQVHERRGVLAAWGSEGLTEEMFHVEREALGADEELYEVGPEHVVELLCDALYWSRDLAHLPADFYLRRSLLRGCDISRQRYLPDLPQQRLLSYQEGVEACDEIFADPFFSGWFMAEQRVYDLAESFRAGEQLEQVLERFCSELIAPHLDRIRERLLICADLMRRCGHEMRLWSRVAALAQSLVQYRLPHHLHPFLRRFALESMEVAREALAEGLDLRLETVEEL